MNQPLANPNRPSEVIVLITALMQLVAAAVDVAECVAPLLC